MHDNIDFAALPDAEATRLMAEKDGWRVVQLGDHWMLYEPGKDKSAWLHYTSTESELVTYLFEQCEANYPRNLDAAVAWLGRMGFRWTRENWRQGDNLLQVACVFDKSILKNCIESDTCPTARALCNAGWAAVQAREAGNG